MIFMTEPMIVLDFGYWEIDGKKVTNKAGEPVEYVQLLDLDADEIHRFTVRGVGLGDRPTAMSSACVRCEAQTASKGREDGSVTQKLKVAVVGFEKAPESSSAKAAAPALAKS